MEWPGHIVFPCSVTPSFCHHSLSYHYLNNRCSYSTEIDYVDVSYTGFEFDYDEMIFDRVKPLELKKKLKIHFQIIISTTVAHIQLKFNI